MTGLRNRIVVVLGGLLAIMLLLAEYALLQDDAWQRTLDRQAQWGQYSLGNLNVRLQGVQDSAQLLLPVADHPEGLSSNAGTSRRPSPSPSGIATSFPGNPLFTRPYRKFSARTGFGCQARRPAHV